MQVPRPQDPVRPPRPPGGQLHVAPGRAARQVVLRAAVRSAGLVLGAGGQVGDGKAVVRWRMVRGAFK